MPRSHPGADAPEYAAHSMASAETNARGSAGMVRQQLTLWHVLGPDLGPVIMRHVDSARSIIMLLMSHSASSCTWPTLKADCNAIAIAALQRSILRMGDERDTLWNWASCAQRRSRAPASWLASKALRSTDGGCPGGKTVGHLYHRYFLTAVSASDVACMVIAPDLRTRDLLTMIVMRDPHAIRRMRGAADVLRHEAVRGCGMTLRYVALRDRTRALCMRAVRCDGLSLIHVPCHLRTEGICIAAVRRHGLALQHVPDFVATRAMCRVALENTAWAIGIIPQQLLTIDMCHRAVTSGKAGVLRMIPEAFRTEHICVAAVGMHGTALRDVPSVHACKERVVLCALQQDRSAAGLVPQECLEIPAVQMALARIGQLQMLPELHRTLSLCNAHCAAGGSLRYVPMHLRTEEMCRVAVAMNSGELHNAPVRYLTRELCRVAVQACGLQLARVPIAMQDAELCMAAVSSHGRAVHNVRQDLRTEALMQVALSADGTLLSVMPHCMQDTINCCIAVKQTASALAYVQWHLIPRAEDRDRVCTVAVRHHGVTGVRGVQGAQRGMELASWYPLLSIPVQHAALRSHGHVLSMLEAEHLPMVSLQAAVKSYPAALLHIPEAMQTAAICLMSVSLCGRMLHLVPPVHRSETLCMAAIENEPTALQFVPADIRKRLSAAAVAMCGQALQYVPHAQLTREMCLAAVRNPRGRRQEHRRGVTGPPQHSRGSSCSPLYAVPHDFLDHDMCVAALNADPLAITYVPMHLRKACALSCASFAHTCPDSWRWRRHVPLDAAHVEP